MKLCEELGYIEKGTGKHQSNTVYGGGALHHVCVQQPALNTDVSCISKNRRRKKEYILTNDYSYCIDASYYKGTSFKQFISKHRRQLIIEKV